jgi:LPXTG-site transpeptidase (sortase) family protein
MSNLPALPRRLFLRASLALSVTVLSLALVACGGGKSTDDGNASADTTATTEASPTAVATETAPAFRTDCEAIRGTPFTNPEEQAWYKDNCARTDGPKVPAPASGNAQVPIGDTLIIPSAGVETPISRTTVPESGAMPDPTGYFNAVWYDFSKFDRYGGYANAGNLILSGHVDCAHCIGDPNGKTGTSGRAIFWSIRNLKVGDTAQYKTADGQVINYAVVSSEALSVNSDWDKIVSSNTADMTLITCTGTFSGGEYNQRHVVAFKKV